uniref:Uncharacterized protein n=2 Tax=unclassified Ackermannviridae TaxID=2175602 RepID=A0A8S5VL03_9CAUD|nr:MAG TPA: hypothetical protein [Ackermannviridae sp. ctQad106]DAG90775.1 MAG TPA: hypothetical protein [Ackermannviridae sp.]
MLHFAWLYLLIGEYTTLRRFPSTCTNCTISR